LGKDFVALWQVELDDDLKNHSAFNEATKKMQTWHCKYRREPYFRFVNPTLAIWMLIKIDQRQAQPDPPGR
jgi:hypothetical protein